MKKRIKVVIANVLIFGIIYIVSSVVPTLKNHFIVQQTIYNPIILLALGIVFALLNLKVISLSFLLGHILGVGSAIAYGRYAHTITGEIVPIFLEHYYRALYVFISICVVSEIALLAKNTWKNA